MQSPKSAAPPPKSDPRPHRYDIGRQGSWQKPKSPARPNTSFSNRIKPRRDVETPVQIRKRREQELKDAAIVKSEPMKVAPAPGKEVQPRNSTVNGRTRQRAIEDFDVAQLWSRRLLFQGSGSVQSPPWMKPNVDIHQPVKHHRISRRG
jgi:hypothetical protein